MSFLCAIHFPLVQGNNATTIYALGTGLELVTFDEALSCASSGYLHPSLRSKYVKLMTGEYLHVIKIICERFDFPQLVYIILLLMFVPTVMYVDVGENRDCLDNLSYAFVSFLLMPLHAVSTTCLYSTTNSHNSNPRSTRTSR